MMQIECPHCGKRAQAEFQYERTLDSIVMPDMAPDAAIDRLFARANPRGIDRELWRHAFGCRQWLVLERSRLSHAITGVAPFQPGAEA
jgi:sarcosine oxidase subunit delta